MKKFFLGIIVGAILVGCITVCATNLISGTDVSYDNTNSNLTSTNINDALDELYKISETHCPAGYKCKELEACAYEIGQSWEFTYKGSVESFIVPCSGLYELEVYGAQGGTALSYRGGYGGYSVGYKEFDTSDVIYIVVGGKGSNGTNCSTASGGYNGGASASSYSNVNDSCDVRGAGGGATHMALVTGTLASIGYDSFVTNGNGLIVAGGGGGGIADSGDSSWGGVGGAGGGNTDSKGNSTFGKGTSSNAAGGGGLYGGTASAGSDAGGIGYIGGVPSLLYDGVAYNSTSSSGVNSGNGKAKITLIAR